jgi:hypothetical protein
VNHRGLLTAAALRRWRASRRREPRPHGLDRPVRPVVASAGFVRPETERWGAVIRCRSITLE